MHTDKQAETYMSIHAYADGDLVCWLVWYIVVANCRKSLGMQSGAIPDSAISASSSYDNASVGPSNARSVYLCMLFSLVSEEFNKPANL